MNMFKSDNPENSPEAATTGGTMLERTRQMVDDAFAETGHTTDVFEKDEQLPATTRVPVTKAGQVIDEAKHQLILAAQAAVESAFETMPKPEPSQPEDLLLG